MYLNVLCLLVFGFMIEKICGGPRDKLHIPDYTSNHHYSKFVGYEEPTQSKEHYYHYATENPYEVEYHKKQHPIKEYYHYKTESPPKKEYYRYQSETPKSDSSQIADYDKTEPIEKEYYHFGMGNPEGDGYQKSWKTLRSEKYQTETVKNPHSDNPDNRYIVKSRVQVREKLPFEETTIGYDQEHQYPLADIDHDYHKQEKIVDFKNAKYDPFPKEKTVAKQEQKKKPKQYHYSYQYPRNDLDYHKNVHVVDFYIQNQNNPDYASPKKPKKTENYAYSIANELPETYHHDSPKPSHEDHVGPHEYSYQKFKTDGPSYDSGY